MRNINMSVAQVKAYFAQFSMEERVLEIEESSATVEAAARALHCEAQRIAKTLSFYGKQGVILVVTAGDRKIDNKKYREYFGLKAQMLKLGEVEPLIGHEVGGVCPFAVAEGVAVYLDVSLMRFETVFPAAGSANSMIELNMEELERYSNCKAWVDVCKEKA